MAIRIIVKDPDPVLREKAITVTKFNSNLHKLLNDMADTMYEAEGVGLAAPQIGILKRVIVMDCGEEHGGLIEMVNPEVVTSDGEQIGAEGCLSIPGLRGDVTRPLNVTAKGQDRNGNPIEVTGTELLARCIFHEIDHLNGILFTDLATKTYTSDEEEDAE
ncbi:MULTISPECIES: peptide deformylase [Paenibacillus]|uniref:Peptide deformylase n=2 Tax=Paenibacillus TaxID=44249 RepID=A0A1V4HG13_9BACL|nr:MULTISPECIES: peptide deformylase [Paenibacillus]MEC0229254.1 peptide deformylase [Paenibacillus alba]NQX65633.1 peptide deformylase [Paenibacillus alba]OPH53020.1 peptide deformylase [Paenibacillus ferrarius]